jgi:hypothetical protein
MKCPVCSSLLEKIDVAPCYDCGHDEDEIEEFNKNEHSYNEYKIFDEEIILCNFCDVDFHSYYPEYFGLPRGYKKSYELDFLRSIEKKSIEKDYYCKTCNRRLAFLNFLSKVINKNTK